MTTLAELVAAAPAAGNGVPTQLDAGDGVWRWVIELADPAAGSSVEWFDITTYVSGVDYTRGADEYAGRYRAAIAELELQTDNGDELAPWNDDTSSTFGVHVDLGAGLLIRAGLVRVVDDTVVEWLPRFTQRVETWRDATFARGQIRQHRVTTRDLMTELVGVPIASDLQTNWLDRAEHVLTEAGWPYGWTIHGAELDNVGADILTLPDRPESLDAIVELDATFDPAGVVWRTNRKGQLIAHPMPGDTFHAAAFTAGATGTPWVDTPVVSFAYTAELDGRIGYVVDDNAGRPFGVDDSEVSIKNHLRVTDPTPATYDVDDPVSIQRYGRKTLPLSWIVANDDVVDVLLATRATATKQATPLQTSLDLPGFFPAAGRLDPLTPMIVVHETGVGRDVVTLTGRCRQLVERYSPRSPAQINWSIVAQVDVDATSQAAEMLPVTGLSATSVNHDDATFGWVNPTQVITPTETWVRIPQQSLLWLELDYPMTELAWLGLVPATPYQFDVRLVRRADGLVTNVSPVRSTTFVTDPSPAPVVGTDGGGGLVVDLPDVDDPELCVVQWVLESTDDGTTWAEVTSGEAAGGTEIELAAELFETGLTYRVCSTEVCDEIPGTTYCSAVVVAECQTPPDYPTVAPYDRPDLIAYVPEICSPDVVVEAVSGLAGSHGPAWGGVVSIAAGELAIAADTGAGGVIAYGETPALSGTGSVTIGCEASPQSAGDQRLWAISGLRIDCVDAGTGWYPQAGVTTLYGDEATVTDTTIRSRIAPLDVKAQYDAELGRVGLFVNDVLINTADVEEIAPRAAAGPYWRAGVAAAGYLTNCAVWSSLLAELPPPAAGLPVTAGLTAWWDASDETTITTSGSAVTAMTDKSPSGHDLAPRTTGPDSGTRTMNGLNVLDFVSGELLEAVITANVIARDPVTVFAVAEWDTGAGGAIVFEGLTTQTVARVGLQTSAAPGVARHNLQTGGGSFDLLDDGALNGDPHLWTFHQNGTVRSLAIDGGTPATDTVSLTPATHNRVALGAYPRASPAFYFDGAIAEVIVYDVALSAGDRALVTAYLADKWGITL